MAVNLSSRNRWKIYSVLGYFFLIGIIESRNNGLKSFAEHYSLGKPVRTRIHNNDLL